MRRCLAACCATFALLLPAVSHAAITPEARAVVQRYLEASGGAAAFAAESTSYVHAKVFAFGFEGTFASWAARPGRRYARTELGPFKLEEGSDGTTAWRTDPTTGVIRPLADHDLADALESTWFELERWAEPGEGGGNVALAAHEKDATASYTVLEVSAPDLTGKGAPAKPRRLWFRDSDGLVVRTITRDDQREVTTTLSGHEKRAGRVRGMISETVVASMPANKLRTVADTVLANVSMAGLPFTPPKSDAAGDAVQWLGSKGVARLPFEYRARHVWLKARVNGGAPDHFLFDTGASVTVLDSAWAAEQGIQTTGRMQAAGAGASGGATFATLDS
ncbi:MAG: aspartyl protease family protein, partial [Candidatus Eisenbacteria bacterium]|nr:aspartyl protease family protein [Candidatus Eisenbacteria bacterium]